MDPQINERLDTIEKKLERIDKVVTKTRQVQKNANTIKLLYWVFLILLGLGAFYFIKPFISQLKDIYGFDMSQDGQSTNNIFNELKSF